MYSTPALIADFINLDDIRMLNPGCCLCIVEEEVPVTLLHTCCVGDLQSDVDFELCIECLKDRSERPEAQMSSDFIMSELLLVARFIYDRFPLRGGQFAVATRADDLFSGTIIQHFNRVKAVGTPDLNRPAIAFDGVIVHGRPPGSLWTRRCTGRRHGDSREYTARGIPDESPAPNFAVATPERGPSTLSLMPTSRALSEVQCTAGWFLILLHMTFDIR